MATITIYPYATSDKAITSMPHKAFAITPSDSTTFSKPIMVCCTVAGNVSVVPFEGDANGAATALTIAMEVGDILPFCVSKVNSTSTTATVIGLF